MRCSNHILIDATDPVRVYGTYPGSPKSTECILPIVASVLWAWIEYEFFQKTGTWTASSNIRAAPRPDDFGDQGSNEDQVVRPGCGSRHRANRETVLRFQLLSGGSLPGPDLRFIANALAMCSGAYL